MDPRLDDLSRWAADIIRQKANVEISPDVETVSGDASFRRYFRLKYRDRSWILVDAPPAHEDCSRFVSIASEWRAARVRVPQVLAVDLTRGYMVLEDFGDELLWSRLHKTGAMASDIHHLYEVAIDQLVHLQAVSPLGLPAYDEPMLRREMALFTDWLCLQQLGLDLTDAEQQMLTAVFDRLVERARAQPVVTVHRDYHSRNLMVLGDNELGIIDFQDAVAGPATYDLISLLRDCYVRWDKNLVEELLAYYWQSARQQGIYLCSWEQLVIDADWMGMQRHLKAAGIFARLNLRDGKSAYLADIPNTCRYLRDIAGGYAEFSDFCQWLDNRFLPALELMAEPA
jgi:N-acetylmuramate 1-kinase